MQISALRKSLSQGYPGLPGETVPGNWRKKKVQRLSVFLYFYTFPIPPPHTQSKPVERTRIKNFFPLLYFGSFWKQRVGHGWQTLPLLCVWCAFSGQKVETCFPASLCSQEWNRNLTFQDPCGTRPWMWKEGSRKTTASQWIISFTPNAFVFLRRGLLSGLALNSPHSEDDLDPLSLPLLSSWCWTDNVCCLAWLPLILN